MPIPPLPSSSRDLLLVIDVQEKLTPHVAGADRLTGNLAFLLDAARMFAVEVRATEQYPRGLGPTVAALRPKLPCEIPDKFVFSAAAAAGLVRRTASDFRVVLAGIETHVCVLQTARELVAAGYETAVVVDAVSSRHAADHAVGLRRMEAIGVVPMTVEMIGFEWCGRADRPEFKEFSRLVKLRDEQLAGEATT